MTTYSSQYDIQEVLLQFCLDKLGLIGIVVHNFKQKLNASMRNRKNQCWFGKAFGHVHVIRFQKPKSLHMHFLIFLAYEDKIIEPAQCVQNSLMNKKFQKHLNLKHMIHGLCIHDSCLDDMG